MQEYYSVYADGQSAYTPGDVTRNELLGRINGTADVAEQLAAFADFQRFENVELSDIPLYYQQLYIFESDRIDRNGGLYGNDRPALEESFSNSIHIKGIGNRQPRSHKR